MKRASIRVYGIVQGVGFRPFVYNLAISLGIRGFVLNDSDGVVIEAEGEDLDRFIEGIRKQAPPLAVVKGMEVRVLPPVGYKGFEIRESLKAKGVTTVVPPDTAICEDCLRELFDERDRRYLYPFINCTNCGPRYTITYSIPYDRPNTTMRAFRMCEACEREYRDPASRRFHAQPNACPVCGPRVWLVMDGREVDDPIASTIGLLKEGAIVAIKGLGGFHLACDASNEEAVKRLRERKRRSNKPFAIMVPDLERAKGFCEVLEGDQDLLRGPVRPIVIMKRKGDGPSQAIAPGNDSLGIMLPYTPLHYLLFYYPPSPGPRFDALVMTSGNLSEEPIAIGNEEALERLSSIADAFLLHNRDIYMRVDDSVVRGGKRTFLVRRARGYVPAPVDLGAPVPQVLALGGELKTTFCLTKGRNAFMSQHVGDMENVEAIGFYKETLRNLMRTLEVHPEVVAHDLHPNYWTTTFASRIAEDLGTGRVVAIQHHHAHIVSCMAENGLRGKVLGVAFDGTGYGEDGKIWGGEFLVADERGFERFAHLRYVPMPGGDRAVKEPFRMAVSYLYMACGRDGLDIIREVDGPVLEVLTRMVDRGVNSPLTSSCGRLFDALSSILGLYHRVTFEGEAAIGLEALSSGGDESRIYPFHILPGPPYSIDTLPIIRSVLEDVKEGRDARRIGRAFHNTLAEMVLSVAGLAREERGVERVVLSGGCFQNRLLLDLTVERLEGHGFEVYTHRLVPPNDGGISLGQALVASSLWEGSG